MDYRWASRPFLLRNPGINKGRGTQSMVLKLHVRLPPASKEDTVETVAATNQGALVYFPSNIKSIVICLQDSFVRWSG